MRTLVPLEKVFLAVLLPYLALLLVHRGALGNEFPVGPASLWLLLGVVYTHFFEYWYHRIPMHRGIKFLRFVQRNHLDHHRIFNGDHFSSRRHEDLEHIVTPWYVFPSLFLLHYLVLQLFLSHQNLVAFFGGVSLHYVVFETTHWFTHVADNSFDKTVSAIPVLNRIRDFQIRHHRLHHETPEVDYNFNPPFLGDIFCGTWRAPGEERSTRAG